jgi:hypothetical protein
MPISGRSDNHPNSTLHLIAMLAYLDSSLIDRKRTRAALKLIAGNKLAELVSHPYIELPIVAARYRVLAAT